MASVGQKLRHTVECQWTLSAAKKIKKMCSTSVLRHTVVCQWPRKQKNVQHTSVLFTGIVKLLNSAFRISKTTKPIYTKLIIIIFSALHIHYVLHILKFKEIALALLEIFVPKNCPFFTFFFFYLSCIKITFLCPPFQIILFTYQLFNITSTFIEQIVGNHELVEDSDSKI